jgi:hypothetical protein
MRLARWMSLGMKVTRFTWIAQRLVSSNRPTKYASLASCNAITAELWNLRSVLKSWAISRTRQFPYKQLSTLLIPTDLPQRNRTRAIMMRFLHTTGRRSTLPGCFGSQLLPWRFTTSRLECSMLHTSHTSVRHTTAHRREHGNAVGWGTMLPARRSRIWFPIRSLDFSIDLILPAALWPWGWLNL